MIGNLPRTSLGFWPTPLHKLQRLTDALEGPDIYIKRDDLSGLATGGNKTRKLEFLVGDAKAKGFDTVITAGATQSNHCRQTAAAAAAKGLQCHLVLGGQAPLVPDGNLLLDQLLGAHLHWSGEYRKGETIPQLVEKLREAGRKPYVIPYGGSNPIGALGFAIAVHELKNQLKEDKVHISHIIFASSSGGTHAGLAIGARFYDLWAEIYGISVDKRGKNEKPFATEIAEICDGASRLLGDLRRFDARSIKLDDRFLGKGYGIVGDLERNAIRLLATTEGILLDPVYTARAFGAMVTLIKNGTFTKNDTLLFWHTGGIPALFPYSTHLTGHENL